jgi:hypothetical protein
VNVSKVGGSWMMGGRPRSGEEAAKRGMKGRTLSPEELAIEAAKMGLEPSPKPAGGKASKRPARRK